MITVTHEVTRSGYATLHFKHILVFEDEKATVPKTSTVSRKDGRNSTDLGSYHWSNFSKAEQAEILAKLALFHEAQENQWVPTVSQACRSCEKFITWVLGENTLEGVKNVRMMVWRMKPETQGWKWDAEIHGGGAEPTRELAMLAAVRASKNG